MTGEPATLAEESDVDQPRPDDTTPWQHLDIRVVWVNAAIFLFSLGTGLAELYLFPNGELWPLLIAAAFGVLDTTVDLIRWATTRYRITDEQVETRVGWLRRETRYVPRERIRSVDTTAKLRHRVAKLRIVHIGAGEERLASTFKLDALPKERATQLRDELIPGQRQETADNEQVISRVRWHWVFYAMFQFWVILAAGIFLNACYWFLKTFGVDLLDIADHLATDAHLGFTWTAVLVVLISMPLGGAVLGVEFITKYWNFELVRTTDKGGALVTRQGLFSTQTVYREDRRIRGIHVHEPLVLRWMRLAQATVVTTGIHKLRSETAHILPRCPVEEVHHAARSVLPDGHHPLEAPLQRHPWGALRKRLLESTSQSLILAGLLYWLGDTDVLPYWWWRVPLFLLPLTWAVVAISYTWLGHALVGPYVVFRTGALTKSTVALQSRAIAGWRLHQTIFQRIGKRITVGIPTAAGERYYHAPDAGTDQALALIKGATPWLAAEFIETVAPERQSDLDHPAGGGHGGRNAAH